MKITIKNKDCKLKIDIDTNDYTFYRPSRIIVDGKEVNKLFSNVFEIQKYLLSIKDKKEWDVKVEVPDQFIKKS